jgi:hypothetical protein
VDMASGRGRGATTALLLTTHCPADARSGALAAANTTAMRHFYFAGSATFELGCNMTASVSVNRH